jgi:cysteine desulfuration protein SufE
MIKDLIKAKGDEISVLEGTDRLQYLIDLAKEAGALEGKYKVDQNKIFGCASNLWVVGEKNNGNMKYQFDADAFITKGTTKFVIDILNNQPAEEISKLSKEDFKPLGIMELLTAQRQSGLSNLLDFLIKLAK